MFHTQPEAEIKLPQGLTSVGERSWNWVELALQIPYLYISVNVDTEDGSCGRHFLFSQLMDAMSLIADSKNGVFKDLEIGLLSPGYMNGGNFYQFGRVKEIWKRQGGHEQMFVMSDGAKLYFPPDEGSIKNQDMELIVSLQCP